MIKLHDGGAYLVNGQTLVPDDGQAQAAIQAETGAAVAKEEAAKCTIAYNILAELTSHDITFVGISRRQGLLDWRNSRFPMC